MQSLVTDVARHMSSLDDQELLRVFAFNRGGYSEEAIEIAAVELRRRSLPVLTAEEYLHRYPGERITETGFCITCMAQTTDESPGNTYLHVSLGAFGTSLSGDDDPCPACGSVVQTKRLWIIFPVAVRGRYRIIYPGHAWGHLAGSGRFIGRRLIQQESTSQFE